MNEHDGAIGTATVLLQHYLKISWKAAGLKWTEDNDAEIEHLVGSIIAAAKEQKD
jgi:hypothetical protein